MRTLLKGLTALFAFLLLAGCAQSVKGGLDTNTSENLSEYIESLIEEQGKTTITLDLADDKQYEYVKNSYLETGQTPENSPELFETLEAGREAALKSRDTQSRGQTVQLIDTGERDFMVSSVMGMGGRAYVTLTSTVKNGSLATFTTLIIKDEKGNILANGSASQFTNGKCVVITVDIPLPKPGLSVLTIEGVEMLNVSGIIETRATNVKSLIGDSDIGLNPRIYVEHPKDKNNDGEVFIGLDRTWEARDDYSPMSDFGRIIKVPFKGAYRLPYKVTPAQVDKANTYIKLSGSAYGGTTSMKYRGLDGAGFADALKFSEGPNNSTIIEWDIPREDCWFDNNALYTSLAKVNWYINIRLIDVDRGNGNKGPLVSCASNENGVADYLVDNAYPPHLVFHWSCIAAGSVVKMADGSFQIVEKVKVGDVVKANGMNLTVVDVSIGKEFKEMYRVVDEDAHNLLITERHPLLTKNRGVIWPSELAVGDLIVTENGTKSVTYIGKEMYDGTVHNLMLGTEKELAQMPENANMFFANGILIADGAMQSKYEFKDQN